MDHTSFDRIARLLGGAATRRQGLAAALGGVLGAGLAAAAPAAAAQSPSAKIRRRKRPGITGPCGDGTRAENVCDRDKDCCTGICNRKAGQKNIDGRGRCRCIRRGEKCQEERNCCRSMVCRDKICAMPGPACTVLNQGDAATNGAALVAAINAAAPGAVITIEPGTYQEDYEIQKNLTLVRCGDTGEVIMTNKSASTDSAANLQGRVILTGAALSIERVTLVPTFTVTIDTISIVGNTASGQFGGGIYVGRGATVDLVGGTVVRMAVQDSLDGGGILVDGGTLRAGCDRVANPACTDTVLIGDADPAKGNSSDNSGGGGFFGLNSATIVIRGNAQVLGNYAITGGGGTVSSGSTLTVTDDAKIRDNTAQENGGGVEAADSTVTISGNAQITGNEATSDQGGGVYASGSTVITMSGNAAVSNNTAPGNDGGGLYIPAVGSLVIAANTVRITGNQAGQTGGGVFQQDDTTAASGATATTVTGNTAVTCNNYYSADRINTGAGATCSIS
ncbi:MAG: hypothetical protein ACKOWF_10390 [Chloroflexota bacterium]